MTYSMFYYTYTDIGQEDHESSEVAMENDSNSGRDAQGEGSSGGSSWRGSGKSKNEKKKFDISLPAQHLVRLKLCALSVDTASHFV